MSSQKRLFAQVNPHLAGKRRGGGGPCPPTHHLAAQIMGLPKLAVVDLLCDAMDRLHGEGNWSADDFIEFAAPRLRLRGEDAKIEHLRRAMK